MHSSIFRLTILIVFWMCGLSCSRTDQAVSPPEEQQVELFPLSVGLRWDYMYTRVFTYNQSLSRSTTSDSGILSYVIVDSVTYPNAASIWTVLELRSFRRHLVWSSWSGMMADPTAYTTDTTYSFQDSMKLYLQEDFAGDHQLFTLDGTNLWGFSMGGFDSVQVFRYDSKTSRIICLAYTDANTRFSDTLSLESGSGLIKRAYHNWHYGYGVEQSDSINASLLHSPRQIARRGKLTPAHQTGGSPIDNVGVSSR